MRRLFKLPNKRQKTRIELSDFLGMKEAGYVLPQAANLSSCILHHSCKTLPLDSFIQAYCNNDLSGLVISGTKDESIHAAWNEILFEYSGLIKNDNSDYLFDLQKSIAVVEHHIIYIDYAIPFLKLKYDEDIAGEVRELGYEVPLFDAPNYQRSLSRITSLAKTKVIEHKNLVDEYERINKTVSGKKQDEDEFVSTVLMLSKYQGYNIDRKITTVYEFTQVFNNYISEMRIKEKQLEKYK